MNRIIALILISLLTFLVALAAPVRGRVVDGESGMALEFVNVVAYDADSVFVDGCVTDSLGRFAIARPETAMVGLMLVGYEPGRFAVDASGEMGDVALMPLENRLGEVTVNEVRPETRLQGTSFVTTVSNTFMSKLMSAPDVLNWIPGLAVSNKQVKVFQKTNPLIYINNRKIRSFNEIEMLEPANIASVEVIPNTGVKYGLNVDCVVIIHTKRNLTDHLGVSLYSSNTVAHYYSNAEVLNVTYRNKGLEVTVDGMVYPEHSRYGSEMTYEAFGSDPWVREARQIVNSRNTGGNVNVGISYDFSPTQSVGVAYMFGALRNHSLSDGANDMSVAGANGSTTRERLLSAGDMTYKMLPNNYVNLYYKGSFGALTLDFNADWNGVTNAAEGTSFEQSDLTPPYHVNTSTDTRGRFLAEKLMATLKLKWLQVMVGQEVSHTRMESEFSNAEQIVADNSSLNKETTVAAFAELSKNVGPVSAMAGIRYEHTKADYSFTRDETSRHSRTIDTWFPSVGLTGSFGEVNMSLSYDYRFYRPSYRQLDGSLIYVDPFSLNQGNPMLKSSGVHNVSVNVAYKKVWGRVFFGDRSNPILNVSVPYEPGSRVLLNTYGNFGNRRTFGASAGGNFKLGIWSFSGNVAYVHQWFAIPFRGEMKSMDNSSVDLTINNLFALPWGLQLHVYYSMGTAYNYYNVHYKPAFVLNGDLSRQFFNNKLNVSIGVDDILAKRNPAKISYENYLVNNMHTDLGDKRKFYVTLRYTFNSISRSNYKGTGAATSEKSRLQ